MRPRQPGLRLHQVLLQVKDVERSKGIYTKKLGFKVLYDYSPEYVAVLTPNKLQIGLHPTRNTSFFLISTLEFCFANPRFWPFCIWFIDILDLEIVRLWNFHLTRHSLRDERMAGQDFWCRDGPSISAGYVCCDVAVHCDLSSCRDWMYSV